MKHNWEELLKEYLKSGCSSKTEFAEMKGINPSLLRMNSIDWSIKKAGKKTKTKSNRKKKQQPASNPATNAKLPVVTS